MYIKNKQTNKKRKKKKKKREREKKKKKKEAWFDGRVGPVTLYYVLRNAKG